VEGVFSFDDIKTAALKATQGARQSVVKALIWKTDDQS
jgi:hypothetical protein